MHAYPDDPISSDDFEQVDAKVALEFHVLRNAYPHWFQSQFGNKLLYTGFGALDIVGGGPLHLSSKLTITCDGVGVSVPKNAEGVLIVNIPSYMVGFYDE